MSGREIHSIPEFYRNRSVFITGSTGFMGKVLLEKLLWSCPNIGNIFLLIRPKRGQDALTRLKAMIESKIFERLKEVQPNFAEKVVPVVGDILEPGLGLSDEDRERLVSEVSIVFHSAATVKFDESLKLSIQMNVLGVRKMLELCHQIKHLGAMIHVSTAYSNCDKDTIQETIYPSPQLPHKVIEATDWMDDSVIDVLTPLIVKPRPNTYTFTKAMAEDVLRQERGSLPCVIIRPSIVGAALNEPYKGWVDNFNGPNGVMVAIAKGILQKMHGVSRATSDLVPVDTATNLIIAAAWNVTIERPSNIPVYNCTTGQLNRFTWGQFERTLLKFFTKMPVESPIRVPNATFTSSKLHRNVLKWLDHYLPAWIMDAALWIQGKKPMMTRLQDKLWRNVITLEYFTSHQWVFSNQNVLDLQHKLSTDDLETFNFDVTRIDWASYMENYCLGIKQFLLKESIHSCDDARRSLNRLIIMKRVMSFVVFVLAWRLFVPRLGIARRLWQYVLSLAIRILHRFPGIARS